MYAFMLLSAGNGARQYRLDYLPENRNWEFRLLTWNGMPYPDRGVHTRADSLHALLAALPALLGFLFPLSPLTAAEAEHPLRITLYHGSKGPADELITSMAAIQTFAPVQPAPGAAAAAAAAPGASQEQQQHPQHQHMLSAHEVESELVELARRMAEEVHRAERAAAAAGTAGQSSGNNSGGNSGGASKLAAMEVAMAFEPAE